MSDSGVQPTPDAPWALAGEALIAVVAGQGRARPDGLAAVPGPAIVVAVSYQDSPVGPFIELAVAEPSRLGLRLGYCVTTSVVSAPPARVGGRIGWGIPRELGRLTWSVDGDERVLRWEDRGIEIAGTPGRWRLPFLVPMRSLQRRGDGPVVVPSRVRAMARPGRVVVSVPDGDPLAGLGGRHHGALLHGLRLLMRPARRPAGLLSTLQAPLHAPEPALSGAPRSFDAANGPPRRYSATPPRAYSSVG